MKAWYRFPFEKNCYYVEATHEIGNDEGFYMQFFNKNKSCFLDTSQASECNPEILEHIDFKLINCPKTEEEVYPNLVREAKEKISQNEFEKVVLARQKKQAYTNNPIEIFKKLCTAYENCFVHLVYFDEGYCSIGATPERLLHWDKEKVLSASMAGTVSEENPAFTQKEKEEQSIVTDYITHCFEEANLTPAIEHQRIENGNLQHLYTEIKATGHLNHLAALKLMDTLAPTPAVGGYPKEKSYEWLKTHEKMQREWYSGIIGFIGKNLIRTYVNLRCGLLYKDEAILFAGAGITAGSNPEKELIETEEKMKNLGDFLD